MFAKNAGFSRFERCMPHPIYGKLYSRPLCNNLRWRTIDAFKWRAEALTCLPPRVIAKRVDIPSHLLRADDSFENDRWVFAVVLFNPGAHIPKTQRCVDAILSRPASPATIQLSRDTAAISGLELVAATMALTLFRRRLTGKSIVIYVDINEDLGAIAKGKTPANSFITAMWMVAAALSITIWFGRAPSATSLDGLPARAKSPGFSTLLSLPFIGLQEWLDYTTRIFTPMF